MSARLLLMSVVLLLSLPMAVAAEDYAVVFHRPLATGDTFKIDRSGSESSEQSMTRNGATMMINQTEISGTIKGTLEVLAINESGAPLEVRIVIEAATHDRGDGNVEIVPPGSVVQAKVGAFGHNVLVDGQPATPEQAEALELLINLGDESPANDEVFGTDERQGVGASWPVDAEALAEKLSDDEMKIDPADISGQATLVGVVDVEGVPCLEVQCEATINNMPLPDMPDGATALMKLTGVGFLPVDTSRKMRSESAELEMKVAMELVAGQPMKAMHTRAMKSLRVPTQ